ncbi:hypothetical protein EJB05_00432 [Eragrostis curvula]|uniref:Uncharacterized protein n=1 Tax=Eragrostis curvula TaxID=38414 RepID=A0A5J9WLL1_9POAL|nr:hypothetical protein EJB05_00432 [Eragrostis curvula]
MALVIAFPDLTMATERRGDGDDGSGGRGAEMELCELMMLPKMVVTKRGAVSHKDPASVGCSPQKKSDPQTNVSHSLI